MPAAVADALVSAHRRPVPRVAEGQWLAAQPAVHAMLDCSDGLATDLGHLCRESGVGARVRLDRLPLGHGVREAARALGADPVAWAVSGGEDYELLVTMDHAAAADVCRGLRAATGTALTVVGEVTAAGAGPVFVDARDRAVPVDPGYEHFRPAGGRRG
jgi:thiamine-monophosphate kinase